jgi:hypothetical protein
VPRPNAPRVDAALRDARAMELRAAGATFRQIADQLGVSVATAWKCVDRGLTATRQEPGEKLHALERERLDRLQAQATAILRTRHVVIQGGRAVVDEQGRPYVDHGPTLAAIGQLVRLSESRRRLLGLDAPTRIDAKVSLQVAWERATEDEKRAVLDADIAALQAELDRRGPANPPAAEMLPSTTPATDTPTGEQDQVLAEALAAGLAAAGVDLDDASLERAADAIESYLARRAGPSSNGSRP